LKKIIKKFIIIFLSKKNIKNKTIGRKIPILFLFQTIILFFSKRRHFFHPPKKMSQKKSTNVTIFRDKCHNFYGQMSQFFGANVTKKVRSNVSTIVSQNVHFRKIQKWRTIKVFQVKNPQKITKNENV
jgi:hypothetical protein